MLFYIYFFVDGCQVFASSGSAMQRTKTLHQKIEEWLARKRGEDVFLTREFADLNGERQVLRTLHDLVENGKLIRMGYGVYARAIISRLSGEPLLYSPNDLASAARQALDKLGVEWEPTEWECAYNEQRSTQVPARPTLKVKDRFSRRLSDGHTELLIERQSHA